MAVKAIARRLGLARNTVRSALASDTPPRYSRAPQGSRVDEFEPAIRGLLTQFPDMAATVIAERIGWEHSSSVLWARIAQLRLLFNPPDPADRTTYAAGEIVQCDLWFPGRVVPVAKLTDRESRLRYLEKAVWLYTCAAAVGGGPLGQVVQ